MRSGEDKFILKLSSLKRSKTLWFENVELRYEKCVVKRIALAQLRSSWYVRTSEHKRSGLKYKSKEPYIFFLFIILNAGNTLYIFSVRTHTMAKYCLFFIYGPRKFPYPRTSFPGWYPRNVEHATIILIRLMFSRVWVNNRTPNILS
jgi:hypothetical protein